MTTLQDWLFLYDSKNSEDNLGRSQVAPAGGDSLCRQSKSGNKRSAGNVSSIVAKAITLTHIVRRSLLGGEVGFDPADGVSPEQKSPQVSIAAVKEGSGREASSTPSDATKEIVCIDDRGRAAAHARAAR
jgi:hypothetical protein